MAGRTLLDRLASPSPSAHRETLDASEVLDSVMLNLRRLFNARENCATARPDYGMPDFNDLAFNYPDAIPTMSRAIKYQIEQFEPRLRNVQVRHVGDELIKSMIRFSIRAELQVGDERTQVSLDTLLGADGHVDVRS